MLWVRSEIPSLNVEEEEEKKKGTNLKAEGGGMIWAMNRRWYETLNCTESPYNVPF